MNRIRLVALVKGAKKDGRGYWYKVTLKKKSQNGLIVKEFFVSEEVGEDAESKGLIEDLDVIVELEFDDFLRPAITAFHRCPPEIGEV